MTVRAEVVALSIDTFCNDEPEVTVKAEVVALVAQRLVEVEEVNLARSGVVWPILTLLMVPPSMVPMKFWKEAPAVTVKAEVVALSMDTFWRDEPEVTVSWEVVAPPMIVTPEPKASTVRTAASWGFLMVN